MADRFPLIINPTTKRIEELAAGDNLNLTSNSIVGASTVTASTFVGNLSGVADFALGLGDAGLIEGGTLDPERLNGYYNIGVGTADNLTNAANIQTGIIDKERLSGDYDINITGIAASASVLTDGSNILDGIISADRLSGTYNINITGAAYEAIGAATSVRVESSSENAEYYLSFFSDYETELTPGISTFLVYNPLQQRIGLGTNIPEYNIDVIGDIRASDYGRFNNVLSSNLNVSGATTSQTLNTDLFYSSGISTTGSLSIGSTQVISNSLELQNITSIDEVTRLTLENALEIEPNNFNSLNISGVSTFVGFSTFKDSVNIEDDLYIGNNLLTSGITTLSSKGGITTTGGSLYVNGDGYFVGSLNVSGIVSASKFSTGNSGNIINISDNIISGSAEIVIDPEAVGDNTGAVRIKGDLYVDGTQTYINSTTIELADFNVGIATTVGTNLLLDGAGIGIGSLGIRKTLTYNNTSDSLKSSENFDLPSDKVYKVGGNEVLSSTKLTIDNIVSSGIGTFAVINANFIGAVDVNISGIATVSDLSVGNQATLNSAQVGVLTASTIYGNGANIVGIVTQLISGIGIDLISSQSEGKGTIEVSSYKPIGKTIFVSQTGLDTNTGLSENHPKRTIKAASAIAFPGDTIKVYPGVYVENNPIVLSKNVSVEGTELRNCVVTPKYLNRDLFHVNNSCHITDLSFVGGDMTDGAAVVALQPLTGVATDRFFDAARMVRYNLDFIAAETVGYLTSTDYKNPAFVIPTGDPNDCKDDIKDVLKAVIHDITRGGNLKCVGAGKSYYDESGSLLHITGTDTNGYSVKEATIEALNYAAGIAHSCINNVSWNGNYQSAYSQVKDLAMQADDVTGSNEDIGSCANVVSAIYSCVGVVTSILDNGLSVLGAGINTSFPANAGLGTNSVIGITSAVYDNTLGSTTILAPTLSVKPGDIVEVRDLLFECASGGSIGTQRYPSGAYGYEFDVTTVNSDGSFVINTGISTIAHNYVGGGFVVNRAVGVTTASYDNTTGITTITAPGATVKVGDFIKLHDLEFSCTSGAGTTTLYPTGNLGYEFKVLEVIGTGTTFVVNTGVSTIPHAYEGGGVVFPPYSSGVGPITQGPYVRNCTNFIPKSIGMKVDGFAAEPGDRDDIGVTGTMSVDSYTQYNQGGIGVSITNGAYAQLVSIFTICDDIAIFTGSGGQCDITNSNSSFGRLGLVADGVGDENTKSIYRSTGVAVTDAPRLTNTIAISGVGSVRPYDGQVCYFGDLYYFVESIEVTNGGSGYTSPPKVTVSAPEGPNGITAQVSTTIDAFGRVTSVNIVNSGTQYLNPPTITIDPPSVGVTATASATTMQPIYYKVDSATLPSSGISTVSLLQNLNNTVSAGTTVYFSRVSLQITSSHSFEWVGSGNDINKAKPALGGVVIPENEVVQSNGGIVVYTSTDQAGNFKIGDGVIINQATGQISGRDFTKALFTTMTPFILALSD